jgi:hypothetical protein
MDDPDVRLCHAVYCVGVYRVYARLAELAYLNPWRHGVGWLFVFNAREKGVSMNLNQGAVAQALVDRLLKDIHEFDEALYMSTVIGVLEIVKQQLINDALEDCDD